MISCLLHQSNLHRHLDGGEPLSARAQSHLRACAKCREMLATHSSIIRNLKPENAEPISAPPFLHARVMNAIHAQASPSRHLKFLPGAIAAVSIAIIATFFALNVQQPRKAAANARLLVPTEIFFNATLPENPLETEIQNLRADTLKAAKALAATFLPSDASPERN